ncbi:MAG: GAF domain-containing protein [Rhodoferax sp.]|nr:GAF domain-containing protein [Rhodoferax sp.]
MNAALIDLLDLVAKHHDVATMATKSMPLMVNYLGADNGSLLLLSQERVVHKVLATKETFTQVSDHKVRTVIAEGLAGWVLQHRQGGLASHTSLDARWASMGDTSIGSALVVPLMSRNTVVGLLSFHHVQPGLLRERHLARAAELAQLLAPLFDVALMAEASLATLSQICHCASQPSTLLDWQGNVKVVNQAMEKLDIIWCPGQFSQSLLQRELDVETVVQCDWDGMRGLKSMAFDAQTFQFPGVGVWIQLASR